MPKPMSSYASMSPGLASLVGNSARDEPIQTVTIASIKPFAFQRRRTFNPETLDRLAESIRSVGIVQPLVIRPTSFSGTYELIAGEQRLRAAKLAGLTHAPVIIKELTDLEAREVHLAENLLREDLNALDETEGILEFLSIQVNGTVEEVVSLLYQMKNDLGGNTNHNVVVNPQARTIEQSLVRLGIKWNSFVAHRLPLLKLPPELLEAVRSGLEYTKAQEIARVKDEGDRFGLTEAAIRGNLSLTQIKEQAAALKPPEPEKPRTVAWEVGETMKRVQKAQVWKDPKKAKQLSTLLEKMRSLIDD